MLFSKFLKFFDLLEDKVRQWLSRRPILYSIVEIVGVVLVWRGVWHLADKIDLNPWLSLIIGIIILLVSGLLVRLSLMKKF